MRKTVAITGVVTSLTIIFGGTALAANIKDAPGIDSIVGIADADTINAGPGDGKRIAGHEPGGPIENWGTLSGIQG
jgi:hypothetical protein